MLKDQVETDKLKLLQKHIIITKTNKFGDSQGITSELAKLS